MYRAALLLVLAGGLLHFVIPAAFGGEKADESAKELTGRFLKAINAKDVDALMKVIDVPWYDDNEQKLIRTRDELKKALKKVLDETDSPVEGETIKTIMTYEKARVMIEDEKMRQ